MYYHQLGKSELHVSEISFGCMSLGLEEKNNLRLLHQAFDQGINLFDTADLYQKGMNETFVGKAFKERRDKVIIATKVGNQWRADGSGWDWNPRKNYILKSVDGSLKRLQTGYIDLYQLHGGTIDDPMEETIEAFEILQQSGKIRYYGISSIRPNVIKAYLDQSGIVSIMTQYSLLDRRPEEETLQLIQQNQVGILSRGSLAKGLLAGKPSTDYLGHHQEQVEKISQTILNMADQSRTPAQLALKYVLQNPAVTTAVTGIRTLDQLMDIAGVENAADLSSKEMDLLRKNIPALKYNQHR